MHISSALESPYSHGYMLGLGPDPVDATGISASSIFGRQPRGDAARYGDVLSSTGKRRSGGRGPAAADAPTGPNVPDTHYSTGLWHSFGNLIPCGAFIGHDGADPGYDGTSFSKVDGTRQYAVWTNSLAPGDVVGDARRSRPTRNWSSRQPALTGSGGRALGTG